LARMDEKIYSRYFKAFGDPSRLRIVILLSSGEMTVNDIVEKVGLSQPTVSRHLGILRDSDIVIDRREGQRVYYSLNRNSVLNCCSGFCECLAIPIAVSRHREKR
jgi:DNA-binding transcriptional ArsR family regulator